MASSATPGGLRDKIGAMDSPARPTLLLLHGPGQFPTVWQPVVDHLDPERPMFAPWVKGLKPAQGPTDFKVAEAAADVTNTLELRGIERADLVGLSHSGLVALQAAIDLPDKVGHVVLLDTPLVPPRGALKMSRRALALMPESAFQDVPKKAALEALDLLIAQDYSVDLARVTVPVLALYSESNPSAATALPLLNQIAHHSYDTLPDGLPGAEVARRIEDFIG
jgi:pimeloyl-ACP methyl ester carboxylesterase